MLWVLCQNRLCAKIVWVAKMVKIQFYACTTLICISVQTDASHSIAWNMFLHSMTLWPWPFEIGRQDIKPRVMMDCPCGKFSDCSFSRFGSIMQTNRHAYTQTDTDECFTPMTLVGVRKKCLQNLLITHCIAVIVNICELPRMLYDGPLAIYGWLFCWVFIVRRGHEWCINAESSEWNKEVVGTSATSCLDSQWWVWTYLSFLS